MFKVIELSRQCYGITETLHHPVRSGSRSLTSSLLKCALLRPTALSGGTCSYPLVL